MNEPKIFDYQDYRAFLKDYYQFKIKSNPKWSLGVWARSLKINSASLLSMIISKKRHTSHLMDEKIMDFFSFDKNERAHYLMITKLEKAGLSSEFHLDAIQSSGRGTDNFLLQLLLRELHNLNGNCEYEKMWTLLSRYFNLPVEVLEQLYQGDNIEPNEEKIFNETIEILRLARLKMSRESRRHYSAFIRVTHQRKQEMMKKIANFEKELMSEFDSDDGETVVFWQNNSVDFFSETNVAALITDTKHNKSARIQSKFDTELVKFQ